jgi:hypothetical protein
MADKIVSWGGIDSKGTTGMGVTGSFQVSSSANSFFVGGGNVGIGTTTPSTKLHVSEANGDGIILNGISSVSMLIQAGNLAGGSGTVQLLAGNNNNSYLRLASEYIREGGGGGLGVNVAREDITSKFQVKGSGTTSSTTALLVQNSSANTTFSVKDDGSIFFGTGSITYGPTSGPGAGLKISLVTGWGTAYPVSIGNLNTLGGYVVGGINQGAGSGYVLGDGNTVNAGTGYILGSGNTQNTYNGNHIMIGGAHTSDAYTNNQNASILIGQYNNTNGYYGGGLFGSQLKYYANNQLAFGGNSSNVDFGIREIYFGYGVRNENTAANSGNGPDISINTSQAYSGSGALNRNGGSLSLRGGQGTGTGSAGDVIFATATTGSDGATYHSYLNRVWVKGHTGNVGIGTSTPSASLHVSGAILNYPITLPTASGTASMDCSRSNFFNLTLSGSYTLFLSASNIQPGQTINLRVIQPATSGSLNYGSQFKFAGGIPYSASATSSAVDIISFISFDTTTLYGSAIKNLS